MRKSELVRFEIEGAEMAVRLAGDREKPALLLIHGFPSSSELFRNVIGSLARDCFVITPDLPGFGGSAPVERPSFSRFADMIDGLLALLGAGSFHLYLHDYEAAVGLHLATRAPRRIRGLIVQNANAHESGMGPQWSATRTYWDDPTPEREAEATAHLTFEGTRDYRSHFVRFGKIANYLDRWQPPALMLWGRHGIFFDLEETLSWMKALPRMEAHILDGPHLLVETHPAECAGLMSAFVRRAEGLR
jgi:pimeloyl-ACP methyl ester carboxylesterase